jgi:hypothetical protein
MPVYSTVCTKYKIISKQGDLPLTDVTKASVQRVSRAAKTLQDHTQLTALSVYLSQRELTRPPSIEVSPGLGLRQHQCC